MGKIIKKSVKYLIILTGILIMFPTFVYFAIQIPSIQTGIIKRITDHFSSEFQTTISISSIKYKFFNQLSLDDVLIMDINNDTLLFSKKLVAGLRRINLKGKSIGIGRVSLTEPRFALITDSTGQLNLNWYLDKLKGDSDSIKKSSFHLSISRIDIKDGYFGLINKLNVKASSPGKIDFNNIRLDSLNASIGDFEIVNDSISLKAYDLAFHERNGFILPRMSGSFMLSGPFMRFTSLFLHTGKSILNVPELTLRGDSTTNFEDFVNKVKLNIQLDNSIISATDIGWFAPVPPGLEAEVTASGKFSGTISELRGRDLRLSLGDYTSIDCNFDLSGLPEIENAYIYVGVNQLQTNALDIQKIKIPLKKKLEIPDALYRLGNVTFSGSFTGFTTDFVTYGEFSTALGNIRTDISLRPDKSKQYRVRGLLDGNDINIGGLTGSKLLGSLSVKADVDGIAYSFKKFSGNLKGTIDSIMVNEYSYKNIRLNGNFTEKTWDGSINIADKNIKMDLLGLLNFKDTLPDFDFTLNLAHADLYKLNIDKKDSTSAISLLLTSNFKGNNIDNLDGSIKLLNSTVTKNNKTIDLYDLSLRTYNENTSHLLSLRTDFVNADIKGHYNFAGLGSMITESMASIMPSLFSPRKTQKAEGGNNFTFNIDFRNTDDLNSFFKTGIVLSEKSFIRGSITPDTIINIKARAPFMNINGVIFNDFSFDVRSSGPVLNAEMNTVSVKLPGNTELKDFGFSLKTNPDKFLFNADWDNKVQPSESGTITARGSVSESASGSGKPVLKIDIDPSTIYTAGKPWAISKSQVIIDTNAIKIGQIHIAGADRFYNIDGAISEDPADTLHLQFKGIDISPLNYIDKKPENSASLSPALDIKGRLNGTISLTNVYKNLLLEGNLLLSNFSILGNEYGDISMAAAYNTVRRVLEINAGNNLGGTNMIDITGFYDPVNKRINLDSEAKHLPVGILNPLLKSFASGIKGYATGKLNLSGTTDNLVVKGDLLAENVTMKIDYLQTVYHLNDQIKFDAEGIRFNNVKITDIDGRQAILNGLISHRNFNDFAADLSINMSNDFMVLNTTIENNPTFFGKVYGSGVTKIKIGPNLLSFDISAKTGRNTRLSIPLNTSLSVSEYPFISFVNPKEIKEVSVKPAAPVTKVGLELNIDLTVTPDATAELIFDPKVGDIMSGSGSGILNITLNPKGDFAITGDYTLEQGSYLFTLGNILAKKFEVENGGKILFNGRLEDADIDLKAKYKKFNTSLYPIIPEDQYNTKKIAVEPQLILTGKLFNPTVGFEIDLPNADEDTKAYLKNAISSEEEMSRQFLYLLVTQTFYSEQSSINSGTSNLSGTNAVAATTFEMLSNQLSNWISQINDNFNLGLSYRPGSGDKVNSDEVGVAFETQIIDDRVIINGNFDYKTNAEATDKLTGDFDAELKITEKLRFKVFNRFNDTFLGVRGPYTQGIGIFFRQDFEKIPDLFRKKGTMKKEDTPEPKNEQTP